MLPPPLARAVLSRLGAGAAGGAASTGRTTTASPLWLGAAVGLDAARCARRDAVADRASCSTPACSLRAAAHAEGLARRAAPVLRRAGADRAVRGALAARSAATNAPARLRAQPAERGRLGAPQLGVGRERRKLCDRQHKFRIALGPLTLRDYPSFLPGGARLARAARWVRHYVGHELAVGRAAWSCAATRCPRRGLGPAASRLGARTDLARRRDARRARRRDRATTCGLRRREHRCRACVRASATPRSDRHELRSAAPPCSASSIRWPTRRSKAPPSSASCAAIRTSSCVHWLYQILADAGLRPAPHRPALRARRRARWPRPDGRARPAAARRDVDLRLLRAHRGRGRARLGLRLADVRRLAGAHRPPAGRHAEDARRCATRCWRSPASSSRSSSTT